MRCQREVNSLDVKTASMDTDWVNGVEKSVVYACTVCELEAKNKMEIGSERCFFFVLHSLMRMKGYVKCC